MIGMLALMRAGAIHLGLIEGLAVCATFVVILASIMGVRGGLALSSMVGLGWLFAIGFGYVLYRWNRIAVDGTMPIASIQEAEAVAEPPVSDAIDPSDSVSVGEQLRHVDIFRRLDSEQLEAVLRVGRVEKFQEGYILGVQGGNGDTLYAILRGHVQLQTESSIGQLTVRIAESGESLPLAMLIGDGTLITSAVALSDLSAFVIPRASIFELCQDRPDVGMQIFQAVAEILANRYGSTLKRMTEAMDKALQHAEIWANV
jgi:hypothetical protein